MKRPLTILLLALGAAVLGYALVGLRHGRSDAELAGIRGTDLAWIRAEFALNDTQFAAIESLHLTYGTQCSRHCADIIAARSDLAALRNRAPAPAEVQAAETRVRDLEAFCDEATRAHLRQVAGLMPPEKGSRFLALVEPHLARQPHDGVRGLHP